MIFRAFDELTSSFPAVFWSQLSPADAAELLARGSQPAPLSEERVVGRIDGAHAVLWRRRPILRNPLAPIFDGSFRKAANGCQLVGEFRRRKIMLLLCGVSYFILMPGIPFVLAVIPVMSIWLGASVFWGIAAGVIAALALIGVLLAVAAVMRLAMHAAKQDADRIAEHIDKVFRRRDK